MIATHALVVLILAVLCHAWRDCFINPAPRGQFDFPANSALERVWSDDQTDVFRVRSRQ